MKKAAWLIVIISPLLALGACQLPMFKSYEEPAYQRTKLVSEAPTIEYRLYPPKLMAEVAVSGARREAISDGFRLLADFIFGNNRAQSNIDMTTPVAQQGISEPIDMTAPVAQQASGDDTWHVRFYMPKAYTIDTLPKPNHEKVQIKVQPAYTAVVIRFSGSHSDSNLKKHQKQLDAYIAEQNLITMGGPTYAFYNPPWTPWFMKRNEIIYRLAPAS